MLRSKIQILKFSNLEFKYSQISEVYFTIYLKKKKKKKMIAPPTVNIPYRYKDSTR